MSEEEEEYEIIFEADDQFIEEIGLLKAEIEKQKGSIETLIKEVLNLKKLIK
jgi:hypothetical protein